MQGESVVGLRRQLNAVLSRRPGRALGLWGEAGVGKTFTARALLHGLPCQSLSLHATATQEAIAAALPRPARLPVWAERGLEGLALDALDDQALLDTLAATLQALAPVVLHLEDLHEADPERRALIVKLAGVVSRLRGVGLLVTSRSEPPTPFQNHRLEPLDGPELDALLEAQAGAPLPRAGLDWVQGRTGGNPLFALEFWRYLTRQGCFWSDGTRWHWRAPQGDFVPVTVEALILNLLSDAADTPEARAVLEARAMLPNDLEAATLRVLWAEVAGTNIDALETTRQDFERRGLLHGQDFAHPLLREIVRRETGDVVRSVYASRTWLALEARDPTLAASYADDATLDPEETSLRMERAARRLLEMGDKQRAVRLLVQAVERASGERQQTLALEAARRLRGVDILQWERMARLAMSAPALKREATFLCATALQGDGRHEAAWQLLEALPEADRTGLDWWQMRVQFHASAGRSFDAVCVWDEEEDFHPQASAWTRYRVISSLIKLSQTERASQMIESALAQPDLSPQERARLLDRRNFIAYREARYEAVERTLTEIIEGLDETAFPSDCAAYYGNRSNTRTRLGKHLAARQDAERAYQLASSIGSATYNVGFPTALALAQIYLGEYAEAEVILLDTTALAQQRNHERLWDCYGHLSFLYQRWNPPYGPLLARRYARLSLAVARGLQRDDALVGALADCCRAEYQNDAPQVALAYARELAAVAERTGLQEDLTNGAYHLGRAHAGLGERELAELHLGRAAELYEAQGDHSQALNALLELDRLNGDTEAARHKLAWFAVQGDQYHVTKVHRYFPQLNHGPAPVDVTSTPAVRLNVLGPVNLELNGQPVPTRARKRLELLAYLLETRIAGRVEASALELLDALYPDAPEVEARNTLKQQVYLLRTALGAGSVRSTGTGYALGEVSSDAEDFLRAGAAELWRGPYLGDLTPGWREGVREALTLALRTKVGALLETDPAEAARLGQLWLEMEPYDPEALRCAALALCLQGHATAAQRVYGQAQARLLEVGETLPLQLNDFLGAATVS